MEQNGFDNKLNKKEMSSTFGIYQVLCPLEVRRTHQVEYNFLQSGK